MHNYSCNHSVDKRQERSTAEPRFTDQVRARPSGEKCGLAVARTDTTKQVLASVVSVPLWQINMARRESHRDVTSKLGAAKLTRILHESGRPMLDIYRNYKQLHKK